MRRTTGWPERDCGEGGGDVAPTADRPRRDRPRPPVHRRLGSGDVTGRRRHGISRTGSHARPAGPLAAGGGLVLVLVGALALRETAPVVLPVLLGLFIALVAWPTVGALERRGAAHGAALAVTIAIVLAVVLLSAGVVALAVGQLVVLIPRYEDRLETGLAAGRDVLAQLPLGVDAGAVTAVITPQRVLAFVEPLASAASEAGGAMLVVAFTVVYALVGARSFRARAAAAVGDQHPLLRGLERFGTDLQRYLVVRTKLGLSAAVLTSALLVVLGVPLPVLWAVLVFFASFVPNIGTIIAVVPPTILALLEGGPGVAALVIVGYALINLAQDQLLQPLAMGSELNLSPLAALIAVVVWAWILGPAGVLLAVPLTVGLVMVLEAHPVSRDLAILFRDRVDPPARATR